MNIKSLTFKLSGPLLAAGIAATSLFGQVGHASADYPPTFLKPDLEVTNLTVQKMPSSDKLYIHFLLKNNGVFQVSQPKYSITVNGQVVKVVQTGVLQGGATIGETVMNVEIPGGFPTATVEVRADPYNQLNESNEFNNWQAQYITF
jgi:CARDB